MFDPALQARMTRSWLDAMAGYQAASAAACNMAMGQALDMWSENVRQTAGAFASGRVPERYAHEPQPLALWNTGPAYPGAQAMPNPFQMWEAWASMTPTFDVWRTSTAVWPMVVTMMSYGVPRQVAVPTAEANAAAFEATQAAAQSLENAFSNYRSDGGHASAQLIMLKRMAALLMMGPFGAAALAPWMSTPKFF